MSYGTVVAICIAPNAGDPMQMVDVVNALAGKGLEGDRYANGKGSFNKGTGTGNRQVTLMNARFFLGSGFKYHESRRNIFVSGIELMWLIGREFQIGKARMRGIKYCDPCLRPSKLAQKSERFDDVFEDAGGLMAEILEGGTIRIEDLIIPPTKSY